MTEKMPEEQTGTYVEHDGRQAVAQSALDAEGLTAFLKDKLSSIEMPKQIEFRDELPKTLIGKLSKKELIAEEAAKRNAAANS